MESLLTLAAGLLIVTGLIHSLLGEWLIFRHLRQGTWVPQLGAPPLRARNIRILWATWHLASVFGWGFAVILWRLAATPEAPVHDLVLPAVSGASAVGAFLVLVGTRARHPGWVALGAVASLSWAALRGASGFRLDAASGVLELRQRLRPIQQPAGWAGFEQQR